MFNNQNEQENAFKYADNTTQIPETLTQSTQIDGVQFMAPRGNPKAEIMFVSACPLEEEADSSNSPAFLLKGPVGTLLSRAIMRCGIDIENCWYTTIVKHCLPRGQKLKPKKEQIERNKHLIQEEIKSVQPKLIVCLGKVPFDFFCDFRLKLREALGGLFRSSEHNCLIYCMEDAVKLLYKPELLEKFHTDFYEIKRTIDTLNGIEQKTIPLNYETINTESHLLDWLDRVKDEKLFSVDCEWKGQNFVDGRLRYTQFSWKPGYAVCLQFYDCKGNYKFDISFERVKEILSDFFKADHIQFCGHNIAADSVWLKHWLGIETKRRVFFDTMFALHTIEESSELKLERLSVKFTDLGRYDIDLLLWKKKNKISLDDGYDKVPDEILIPYSCKDVDTVIRCVPILTKQLMEQNLINYYFQIKLPFVADGFASMCETGIPTQQQDIDHQRDIFLYTRDECERIFLINLQKEALGILIMKLFNLVNSEKAIQLHDYIKGIIEDDNQSNNEIITYLKQQLKRDYTKIYHIAEHLVNCSNFNYKSSADLRKWLFDVKELTPIMSTKTDDMPSINWERILELPEDKQKEYNPSTDKDSLKIYADRGDNLVSELLDLKAVNTITRTFLRPNDEEGNEEGLHRYIAADSKVHANFSMTETNRPRTFHPNILNIPKFLARSIENAFKRVSEYHEKQHGKKPEILSDPKPLRWNFKAPPGWCFVEADYKTAEVFAIAYIAGDENLIKTLVEPDTQFALKKTINEEGKEHHTPVRICYNSNTDITEEAKDFSLLHDPNDENLLRDEQGNLQHPRRDVHWELAECRFYMDTPREKLNKDIHRAGGKVGNFSVPYQATGSLVERTIEIISGQKPEPGTGDKIIEAYLNKNPDVALWLENQKSLVEEKGELVSVSGAKRHFHVHKNLDGFSERLRHSILEPLKRQSCNWPIQSIVADSLAKAVVKANELFEQNEMQARVCIPLYDACFVLCPIPEVDKVKEILQVAMCDINCWDFGDHTLKFELESEVTLRWASKMDENDQKEFEKYVA